MERNRELRVTARSSAFQVEKQQADSAVLAQQLGVRYLLNGTEGDSVYNDSKGGVVLLSKNIAMDYGRMGIRCNAICPDFTAGHSHGIVELMGLVQVRATTYSRV